MPPVGNSRTTAAASVAAIAALPRGFGALGRYVLLEMIGQGGMGTVWKAYDPVLDRTVALKLLASQDAPSENAIAEARAMARVQHPNVIVVHDAGVQEAGELQLAYVAMELVEGRTLQQWLADPRSPSADECVELFILAGRGLYAAHTVGLVHRDFKPSNVLLGDDGRVRVSDFGLALIGGTSRADEPSAVAAGGNRTLVSPFAGTPRYMAPEQQHGLFADARSDQYAFCVSLYEAIYGAHPFGEADATEPRPLLHQLPTPPVKSRLTARLAPVILRGLAADPAARWPSMRELTTALELARGRAGRRLLVALGITMLLVVAALVGWRQAGAARRDCVQAADALNASWGPAQRGPIGQAFAEFSDVGGAEVWQRVAATLDDWSTRWRTLRTEQCEADDNGRRRLPSLEARHQCLDRRLGELDALVRALDKPNHTVALYALRAANGLTPPESCMGAEPLARGPTAPGLSRDRDQVAAIRARIDHAAALRSLNQQRPALDEAKAAAALADQLAWPPLTAEAQLELGRAQLAVNATDPATDGFYRALWSAEIARDDTLRLEASMGLFKASLDASSYGLAGRFSETDKAIAQHLPADATRAARLAFDDMRLALYRGEMSHCLTIGAGALRLAEKAAPVSPLVVNVLLNLVRCRVQRGPEALALLQRALPMSEKLNGHQSAQTASVLTELGIWEHHAQHNDESIGYYRQALAIREHMVGPENPDCAAMHNNIGNVLHDEKHDAEAKVELERAIAIWTKAWSADSPAVAVGLGGLGKIALGEGQPAVAENYFRQALAITRKKRPPGHPDLSEDLSHLGAALVAQKKPEAVAVLQEALTGVEHDGDASPSDRADARFQLARARVTLGIHHDESLAEATAACQAIVAPEAKEAQHDCSAWLAQQSAHAR